MLNVCIIYIVETLPLPKQNANEEAQILHVNIQLSDYNYTFREFKLVTRKNSEIQFQSQQNAVVKMLCEPNKIECNFSSTFPDNLFLNLAYIDSVSNEYHYLQYKKERILFDGVPKHGRVELLLTNAGFTTHKLLKF